MASVWGLHREGDEHQWLLASLHTTRESAIASIPVGSKHVPAGPDADWDPDDQEHWRAPPGNPWYHTELRVIELIVHP